MIHRQELTRLRRTSSFTSLYFSDKGNIYLHLCYICNSFTFMIRFQISLIQNELLQGQALLSIHYCLSTNVTIEDSIEVTSI